MGGWDGSGLFLSCAGSNHGFSYGSAIYFDLKIDVNLFLNWANMSLCFYIKFVSVKRSTHLLVYRNCRKGGTLENCGGGGEKSLKANRLLKKSCTG